jgi:hypothetical protein
VNQQLSKQASMPAPLDKKRAGAVHCRQILFGGGVEEILSRLLGVKRKISARSPEERLAAAEDLISAVERIKNLPRDEQMNALAEAEENVTELEVQARSAMAEFEDAQAWLEMMELVAEGNGAVVEQESGAVSAELKERSSARRNAIALAPDTRSAIIAVMQRRPSHEWRPVDVRDAFARAGRDATKSKIETALGRMAKSGEIEKGERGRYRLLPKEVIAEE